MGFIKQYAPIIAAGAYLVYVVASGQTQLLGAAVTGVVTAVAHAYNVGDVVKAHTQLGLLRALRPGFRSKPFIDSDGGFGP